MDNVTHTLIGVTLGHAILASPWKAKFSAPKVSQAVVLAAVLGNNFPDLDFITTFFLNDRTVGYLLHHRGHTHTILAIPILGALAAWIAARFHGLKLRNHPGLLWVSFLSIGTHLFADYWNNYGVHPFWPISARWHYGDVIFIVEPFLWFALLPFWFFVTQRKAIKVLCFVLMIGMAGLVLMGPFVPTASAMVVVFWGLLHFLRQWKNASLLWALFGIALPLAAFGWGAYQVNASLSEWRANRDSEFLDRVTTPVPGLPLCWSILEVERTQEDYRVLAGVVSLAPSFFRPEECHFRNRQVTALAPYQEVSLPSTSMIHWQAQFQAPVAELRRLSDSNCRMERLLRFVRVPYWIRLDSPGSEGLSPTWKAGDLRYHAPESSNFTEIEFQEKGDECPQWLPYWVPPRNDLLK